MPVTSANTRTARDYLRVSYDRSGQERSPDEQHAEHVEAAEEHGWVLHPDPYRDLGSASPYARKERDGYARMLADLRADRFGAEVLILWEGSRGSRQVREWLDLLDLLQDKGVGVYVHTRRRLFDPSNEYDWGDLISDAVKHQLASADTSKRILRTARSQAAQGRPHGRVPFGYARRYWYETVGGKQVRRWEQQPDPESAPLVGELFERVERGHSLRSVSVDWQARGVTNASGRPFSPAHLRALLENRAYLGQRVHDVGRHGRKPSERAVTHEGDWPAIVPEARFLAVQRILADPSRKTSRPGRGVHLLSMIAKCDACGGPMTARMRREPARGGRAAREERVYTCHRGNCTSVGYDALNAYAELVLLGYLARDDVHDALSASDAADETALAEAERTLHAVRAELDDLAAQVGSGALSATLAARAEPAILARLRAAETRVDELRTPSRLTGLIEPGADVAERWETAPMSTKRAVAKILLSREILGELRVTRSTSAGHRQPVSERATFRR